jgi:hypothetical protein
VRSVATGRGVPSELLPLRGRIVSVDRAGRALSVNHETIPGGTAEMTTSCVGASPRYVERVSSGQRITGTVARMGRPVLLDDVTPEVTQ